MIASLLFHGDYAVRTHRCAECTADTFLLLLHVSGRITLLIELVVCDRKTLLGTYINAQSAALAKIGVKSYLCHFFLLNIEARLSVSVSRADQKISFEASSA